MIIEILLAIILGIVAGTFTGLIPGIHINLVAAILLSSIIFLSKFANPLELGVFIIAMSITHTFLDSIPSIYLGAPEESTSFMVLPGHKMLLQGDGHKAIILTIIGSFTSLIISIILFPTFKVLFLNLYDIMKPYFGWSLLILMIILLIRGKKWSNVFVFLLTGGLGYVVLNSAVKDPLFPMLSGLFGVGILLKSIKEKSNIPKQKINVEIDLSFLDYFKSIIGSVFVGLFTTLLPGLSSSQGAAFISMFVKKIKSEAYLVLIGGINTANMIINIFALYFISKSRNGSIIVIGELIQTDSNAILIFTLTAIIASSIAILIGLKLSKQFSKLIEKVNYNKISIYIIILLFVLVFIFSKWLGILILFASSMISFSVQEFDIGKNFQMGCLIVPVLIFYFL